MDKRWNEYLKALGYLDYAHLKEDEDVEKALDILNPNIKNKRIVTKILKTAQSSESDKYKLINASYERSLILSLYFNSVRYATQADFYCSLPDNMGEKILDIGCMNGLLTCFIAFIYPEKTITGVDCDSKSIEYAKKIANILNLNNVTFTCDDYSKLNSDFDTILYSYSLHELMPMAHYKTYDSFNQKINCYKELYVKPLSFINKKIQNVIVFSSKTYALASLAMIESFSNIGLDCASAGKKNIGYAEDMHYYIFSRCEQITIESQIKIWRELYNSDEQKIPQLFGVDAENQFYTDSEKLLYGFVTYKGSKIASRSMISQSISDKTAIYACLADADGIVCQRYDKGVYMQVIAMLSENKKNKRFEEISEL